MKRIFTIAILAMCAFTALAQTTQEEFLSKYNTLSSHVGIDGVGIETHLNKWEEAFPDDQNMLEASFLFYFSKSQSDSTVSSPKSSYLGQKPILELKDSLENPVYFFYDTKFDDEMFGKAIQYIEKANQAKPEKLENRFAHITALIRYEKGSPDMALANIRNLIDYNYGSKPKWVYGEENVDDEFFKASIQEYCYTFFKLDTPMGYEAFREISEKMLEHNPNDVVFMDNLGSYYLVGLNDEKNALKLYNKVLKIKPDDMTAIQNCIVMARRAKDTKLEKKYLPMMIKYAEDEASRQSAQVRLDYINKKR